MLSFQGGIRVPSYTASKSGIAGLTKLLANEWAASGINVNAIAPGYFATNNTAALQADVKRNAEILGAHPRGPLGQSRRSGRRGGVSRLERGELRAGQSSCPSTAAGWRADHAIIRLPIMTGMLPTANSFGTRLMRVAFLGLGNMGAGMAARLLTAATQCRVYNRNPDAGRAVGERWARASPTRRATPRRTRGHHHRHDRRRRILARHLAGRDRARSPRQCARRARHRMLHAVPRLGARTRAPCSRTRFPLRRRAGDGPARCGCVRHAHAAGGRGSRGPRCGATRSSRRWRRACCTSAAWARARCTSSW